MAWRYDLRVGKAFLVLRHRARCVIIQISCCCALQCFPYCVALHDQYQHWPMQLLPLRQRESSWFDFSLWAKWAQSLYKPYELECNLIRKQIGLSSANVFPDWMHDKYLGTDKVQKKLS